jgi:CHAT domain-containing protein/tetratricopeptide (TPR) repeat protein
MVVLLAQAAIAEPKPEPDPPQSPSMAAAIKRSQSLTPEEEKRFDESVRLNRLAIALGRDGKLAEALEASKKATEIVREVLGDEHPIYSRALCNLSLEHVRSQQFDEARQCLNLALQMCEPEDWAEYRCDVLHHLGDLERELGQFDLARTYLEEAMALQIKVAGKDDLEVGHICLELANVCRELGDNAHAATYGRRALEIYRQSPDTKPCDLASALTSNGILLDEQGDFTAGLKLHEEALAIEEKAHGPDHPHAAAMHNNIATLLSNMGDRVGARRHMERSLAIKLKVYGELHNETALAMLNLGGLLRKQGELAAARPYLEKSLALRRQVYGDKHPDVASSLVQLGNLLDDLGDLPGAERCLEEALAIELATRGEWHTSTAACIANLAGLDFEVKDYPSAKRGYQRALAIYQKLHGSDHEAAATTTLCLARTLGELGDYTAAHSLAERALGIRLKELGKLHSLTAMAYHDLAYSYQVLGDYQAAKRNYHEAIAIFRSVGDINHPDLANSLTLSSLVAAATGDWATATREMDEARKITGRYIHGVLSILSAQEQLQFLDAQDRINWQAGLTLGYRQPSDTGTVNGSAEWLINRKAVSQESVARRTLAMREARDPRLTGAAKELERVRQRLAAATLEPATTTTESARRAKLDQLTNREAELSRQLVADGSQVEQHTNWIELDNVRKAIPTQSVLVDIVCFQPRNLHAVKGQANVMTDCYAAWIIPPVGAGQVQIVDLGAAKDIDAKVAAARVAIEHPEATSAQSEMEAEKPARDLLFGLSKQILTPILQYLPPETTRILLSPDANLWLVPWAALLQDDGKYAVEAYEFQYLVSARDLVNRSMAKSAATSAPVILADPDFDLTPAESLAAADAVLRGQFKPSAEQLAVRGVRSAGALPKVQRLPGTAAEAKAIAPSLAAFAGMSPLSYQGKYAQESVFKVLRQPKVLTLCTHGYFLEDQDVTASPELTGTSLRPAARSLNGEPLENPLLRCGLLLAGCNQKAPASTGDDGVLTGVEIVGTDLRGTELVVLSACQTGLGKVHNGEGVCGLRQAFQLAGAQSVVATLWQIPDRDTALLMTEFFDRLAAGETKSRALRSAQLARIEARRKHGGAAHPLFWAAFTVTGQ